MKMVTGAMTLAMVLSVPGYGYAADKEVDKGIGSTPRIQKFQEVERGFWIRGGFGFSVALVDLFGEGRKSPLWPPGPYIGVEIGCDLGQVASLHLAAYGLQISGKRTVGTENADISNDAGALLTMAGGRLNLVTTKRMAWFLKATGGFVFTAPELAFFKEGLVVQVGTGVEYATNLRHFFVGLEVAGQYFQAIEGFSVILTPTLKYTF